MNDHTARLARQRPAWLGAVALLHAAAFMAWRNTPVSRPDPAAQRESALVLVQLPQLPAASRPSRQAMAALPASPAPAAPSALVDAAPPPAQAPAVDPLAGPAAPAPQLDTLAAARLAAGGIDRQLRKESLNRFATLVDEDKAERHSITGGPPRPDPGPESFADASGLVHKRYMLRGKMVCETVDHIGLGGHDVFRNGSKARIVECRR